MADMFSASLSNSSGLVVRYDFSADNIKEGVPGANGIARVMLSTFCDFSCVWCMGVTLMVARPFAHCIAAFGIWWLWHELSSYSCLHICDHACDHDGVHDKHVSNIMRHEQNLLHS